MSASRLAAAVEAFTSELTPRVAGLATRAGATADDLDATVALDAAGIVAAFVLADGIVTEAELRAANHAFSARPGVALGAATPAQIREQDLLAAVAADLDVPSGLFSLLRDADLADGSDHATRYAALALELAHATVAIDAYTGGVELAAVERYRTMLVRLLPPRRPQAPRTHRGGTPPQPTSPGPAPATPEAEALATVEPRHDARSLDDLLAELDELVGLDPVKAEVRQVADLLQVERLRRERGMPTATHSRHLVFTGNPGTGKTTVARLLAGIYRALGALPTGQLVETDRSGLVAGYIGQTAQRVTEVADAADGGVLLIDEAYALVRGDERDFGREAIDTLVKLMEDRRDRLVVIVTGYPHQMRGFIESNPGLRSRFPKTIHFPDYATDELLAILDSIADRHHYRLTAGARAKVRTLLDAEPRDAGFGNARLVRTLFEVTVARQAGRVVRRDEVTDADLVRLTARDVPDDLPGHD